MAQRLATKIQRKRSVALAHPKKEMALRASTTCDDLSDGGVEHHAVNDCRRSFTALEGMKRTMCKTFKSKIVKSPLHFLVLFLGSPGRAEPFR